MASPDANGRWKPVVGYEGRYEVSQLGQVRNASTQKHLAQYSSSDGYLLVTLFVGSDKSNHRVHRLVASAFIRAPLQDEQVNHKDFDKTNNSVANLEWCTRTENMAHYLRSPRQSKPNRGNLSRRRLTEDQVHFIRNCCKSTYVLAKMFGLCAGSIAAVKNFKSYADLPAASGKPETVAPSSAVSGTNSQVQP